MARVSMIAAVLVVWLAVPYTWQGQPLTLTGTLSDASGRPVEGLTLRATHTDLGLTYETVLDSNGRFSMAVPEGDYRIELVLVGFSQTAVGTTRIRPGPGLLTAGPLTLAYTAAAAPPPAGGPPPQPPPQPAPEVLPPTPLPPVPPPPPPPGATSPQPPVYNTIVDGALSDRPLRLPAGRDLPVRFFIGPPDARSALDVGKWTVNPDILDGSVVDLVVTMYCEMCETGRLQKDVMTFRPEEGRSSETRFAVRVSDERPSGSLVFSVTRRGLEQDNITVGFVVGDAAPPDGEPVTRVWARRETPGESVDLVIHANRDRNQAVTLGFHPVHPALVAAFNGKHLDATGGVRTFVNNPVSSGAIDTVVAHLYRDLVGLTRPLEDALRQDLTGSATGLPSPDSLNRMAKSDGDAVLTAIVARTRTLYYDIFLSGDGLVADLIEKVESTDVGRPLRIVIETGDISVPWQMLHPPGPLDDRAVWGFKYELSVAPVRGRAGVIAADKHAAGRTMFGLYGDPADVEVYELGRRNMLAMQVPPGHALVADTKQTFIQHFTGARGDLRLLLAYTHGHGGIGVASSGGGGSAHAGGPRLHFDKQNYVSASDLRNAVTGVLNQRRVRTEFFLSSRPLVFLNACESGASGAYEAARGETFPEVYLWLGARGVVATESPVPAWFGYFFGVELIQAFTARSRFSEAVLETRRMMWRWHNPLGLLYAYVGNPVAGGL